MYSVSSKGKALASAWLFFGFCLAAFSVDHRDATMKNHYQAFKVNMTRKIKTPAPQGTTSRYQQLNSHRKQITFLQIREIAGSRDNFKRPEGIVDKQSEVKIEGLPFSFLSLEPSQYHHLNGKYYNYSLQSERKLLPNIHTNICPTPCFCGYGRDGEVTTLECSKKGLTTIPIIPVTAKQVHLQENNIISVTCQSFEKLHHLEKLDLSSNPNLKLSNCSFSGLQLLKWLTLSGCGLGSLPSRIFHSLNNLQHLDISSNKLTTVEVEIYKSLGNLKRLSFRGNKLTHLRKETFKGLRSLVFLSLQSNQLQYLPSTFEPLAFDGLTSLETLLLGANQPDFPADFTYPDKALSRIPWLRHLYIDGRPRPLGQGFTSLINLTILSFIRSGWDTICDLSSQPLPGNFFEHIKTTQPLDISLNHCGIDKIPPNLFKHTPTINSLDLSENRELGFDGFEEGSVGLENSSLISLRLTNINNARFAPVSVKKSTFRYLRKTKLRFLMLDHNHITYIHPSALFHLPLTLEYLNIYRNNIVSPVIFYNLLHFKYLKVFVASKQNWGHEKRNWNQHGRSLSNSTVQMYPLASRRSGGLDIFRRTLPNGGFRYKTMPKVSDLNVTNLSNERVISEFCGHKKPKMSYVVPLPRRIEEMFLSKIDINADIPPARFTNNKVFKRLDISLNEIKRFCGPLSGLPALEHFDLSGNFATRISTFFFSEMPRLETLLLYNNLLGQSLADDSKGEIFSKLSALKNLDLYNNAIKELQYLAFGLNPNLQVLNLSQNELSSFKPSLQNNTKLQTLDLSSNILVGLSETTCKQLAEIKRLNPNFKVRIRDNRFVCNCEQIVFLGLLVQNPAIFQDFETFECQLSNGSFLTSDNLEGFLPELGLQCLAKSVFMPVLVFFFLIVSTLGIVSVYYYKRWLLRYLYYVGRSRLHIEATYTTFRPLKQVFVTYDEDDLMCRAFMDQEFLHRLQQTGLSFVFGAVDFPAGPLAATIAGAVTNTRKTLVVLSKDIFQDYHRELEVSLAIMHELYVRRPVLVPVLLLKHGRRPLQQENEMQLMADCDRQFPRTDSEQLTDELFENFPPDISVYLQGQAHRCFIYDGGSQEFWQSLLVALCEEDLDREHWTYR